MTVVGVAAVLTALPTAVEMFKRRTGHLLAAGVVECARAAAAHTQAQPAIGRG